MKRRRRPDNPRATLVSAVLGLLVAAGGALGACAVPGAGGSAGATGTPPAESPAASPSATGPSRPFRPTPLPSPTFAAYVVRRGDTLITLAKRFGTTPESLAYWNRARYPSLDPGSRSYRPDRLEVGWELAYLPGAVVDPENLPPASGNPAGEPTPDVVVGPFPTLPADGSAALVRNGPRNLDGVALTFDYAGEPAVEPEGAEAIEPGGAEAIIQWLEVNGVPATVFVGAGAAAGGDAESAAVLRRLAAARTVRAGLLAGSVETSSIGEDLRAADAALAPVLGASTAPLLRPVDGTATAAGLGAAGAAGWTWAIAWDVEPGDGVAPADGGPIAEDIVARVVSQAEGGSIVRLQLGGARTLEALPGILDALGAAGLRVVSLDEVLGLGAGPG